MSSESGGRTGLTTDDSEANTSETQEQRRLRVILLESGSKQNSENCIMELRTKEDMGCGTTYPSSWR